MMHPFRRAALRGYALFAPIIALWGMLGCGASVQPDPPTSFVGTGSSVSSAVHADGISERTEQALIVAPALLQTGRREERPAFDTTPFENAQTVIPNENAPVAVQGLLGSGEDVLVWNLGPADIGESLTVRQIDAIDGYAKTAFFDEDLDIVQIGVLRNPIAFPDHAQVACSTATPTSVLYVAVCAKAEFTPLVIHLEIDRQPGAARRAQAAPFVVLNFDGAEEIRLGTRTGIRITPFRAEDVSNRFLGRTTALRGLIHDAVQRDFEECGVPVFDLATANPNDPDALVVHLGRLDLDGLGAAASQAVVNTVAFSLLEPLAPTQAELAQAIANVVSHEPGHLLGLNHTLDPADIMNPTANPADLLIDQTFRHAPLDPLVFPIGAQDGAKWIAACAGTAADIHASGR